MNMFAFLKRKFNIYSRCFNQSFVFFIVDLYSLEWKETKEKFDVFSFIMKEWFIYLIIRYICNNELIDLFN